MDWLHHHMNFMAKGSFFGSSGAHPSYVYSVTYERVSIWTSHLHSWKIKDSFANNNRLSLKLTVENHTTMEFALQIPFKCSNLKHHCHFDTMLMSCFHQRIQKREWADRLKKHLQCLNRGNRDFLSLTYQLQVHEAHHPGFVPNAGNN